MVSGPYTDSKFDEAQLHYKKISHYPVQDSQLQDTCNDRDELQFMLYSIQHAVCTMPGTRFYK